MADVHRTTRVTSESESTQNLFINLNHLSTTLTLSSNCYSHSHRQTSRVGPEDNLNLKLRILLRMVVFRRLTPFDSSR